jgi:hypothetical protein
MLDPLDTNQQLDDQLWLRLKSQIKVPLDRYLWQQVRREFYARIRDQIGGQLDDQLHEQLKTQLEW